MNKNQIFISAMIDENIKHTAEACNVYCEDILKREENVESWTSRA